ncbi:MAG: Na+/H+ antiporter subunit D [Hyphomicrobiaceae bacterium]|nr:Na+/H+ antiporter subunit D [Hyphomicrobiaceae bacterium]
MATTAHTIDPGDLPRAMLDIATSLNDWVIILPIVLCLMGGAFLLLVREWRGAQLGLTLVFLAAIAALEAQLFVRVLTDGPIAMTMGNWLPPFGITFAVDVLGAGFALAATIATIVVVISYSADTMQREVRYGFYSLIMLLLAGVTGAFLTGDLFNLYVWFEVMLIASFGLMIIGGRKIQLDGAVKYGFLNFLATTFFLIGLGYLYGLIGTLNMADIARVASQTNSPAMIAVAGLFLLAFGMKAAAFPLNAWLPASYHTPDAAISALFGGLLTKVGAYALLRTMVLMMPAAREVLDPVITTIAVATLLLGPMGAMAQTNLRRAVGFIVIGGIGSVMAGIAISGLFGVAGGGLYAIHSMLTMTALYLVAGMIEQVTGTDDIRRMGGIYRASSGLSILFLVLVFASAGLPPFLGFWPKLLLLQGALLDNDGLLVAAILINSLFTSIAGARIWAHVFWRNGREGEAPNAINPDLKPVAAAVKRPTIFASAVLVALILFLGLRPNILLESAQIAAVGLVHPDRYTAAVNLEVPDK